MLFWLFLGSPGPGITWVISSLWLHYSHWPLTYQKKTCIKTGRLASSKVWVRLKKTTRYVYIEGSWFQLCFSKDRKWIQMSTMCDENSLTDKGILRFCIKEGILADIWDCISPGGFQQFCHYDSPLRMDFAAPKVWKRMKFSPWLPSSTLLSTTSPKTQPSSGFWAFQRTALVSLPIACLWFDQNYLGAVLTKVHPF